MSFPPIGMNKLEKNWSEYYIILKKNDTTPICLPIEEDYCIALFTRIEKVQQFIDDLPDGEYESVLMPWSEIKLFVTEIRYYTIDPTVIGEILMQEFDKSILN